MSSHKLYVGNLSSRVDRQDLADLFVRYGPLRGIEIKSGGFGFVEFEHQRDANDAMERVAGTMLNGRPLSVEWSRRTGGVAGDNCIICNETGHWARDCPEAAQRGLEVRSGLCFKCGQGGHLARNCTGAPVERRHRGESDGYSRGDRRRSRSPSSRDRYSERYDSRRRSPPPYSRRSPSPYGRRSPPPFRRRSPPPFERDSRPRDMHRRSPSPYGRYAVRGEPVHRERSPYRDTPNSQHMRPDERSLERRPRPYDAPSGHAMPDAHPHTYSQQAPPPPPPPQHAQYDYAPRYP